MNRSDIEQKGYFLIREYRNGDFEQVAGLWVETGMGNSARSDNEKTILDSINLGGKLLILEERSTGRICGTSWMTCDGRRIHLHHFGILQALQGKKLAHLLLGESLRFVKEKGYQVKLEVHSTNTKAINLYKKHGFEYLGDYDVYIIRDISRIK
ncbi:MAG: GNAT family N-acetyltransferase [Bacteroidales bacterium]|jgi:ribosomal protein S18 acetylase RimI-like enzyme